MTYIYRLAGENLELAEAELNGFLESQNIQEKASRKDRLAETEADPSQLKRLALTHEVCRKICETSLERPDIDLEADTSFAVRAKNLGEEDVDTKDVERELGDILQSDESSVDLENPDKVFRAYIIGDIMILGEQVQSIDRSLFRQRRNQDRPFSSPVSLDPVLARVLVNLSEAEFGEYLLDPFCGTGGILIEAGLCGIGVKGLDIQDEMVEGTQENLEKYGILNHEIRQGDISELDSLFKDYSAVVSDLPYGKASKKTGKPVEKFLEFLEDYSGKTVFMYNQEKLGPYTADYSVYVHKSLERFIYII